MLCGPMWKNYIKLSCKLNGWPSNIWGGHAHTYNTK